jgi:hypothetical protein
MPFKICDKTAGFLIELLTKNIKTDRLSIFYISTPFPTFPQGGRSITSFSPLGETGKGVNILIKEIQQIVILLLQIPNFVACN